MTTIGARLLWVALGIGPALAVADEGATLSRSNQMPVEGTPWQFTPNLGQWPDSILFQGRTRGLTLWVTGVALYIQTPTQKRRSDAVQQGRPFAPSQNPAGFSAASGGSAAKLIRARLGVSRELLQVATERPLPHTSSYFLGDDPSRWRAHVSHYACLTFFRLSDGADIQLDERGFHRRAEATAAPEQDLPDMNLSFENAHLLGFSGDGELLVRDPAGNTVNLPAGWAYCHIEDDSTLVVGPLPSTQSDESEVSTGGVRFSTYLGGSGFEYVKGIAVDGDGAVYVTGPTESADFPILTPLQGDQLDDDVFVTKLTPAGNAMAYSTYLGGSGNENGAALVVDGSGRTYIAGSTGSANFPTNPPGVASGGGDAFVVILSPLGDSLEFGIYLGGEGGDGASAIALDDSDNIVVAGTTDSHLFPLVNPYGTDNLGEDAFLTRFAPGGDSIVYSSYIGGGGEDVAWAVAVDNSGMYVAGVTSSTDFLAADPIQPPQGALDAFVVKLTAAGDSVLYGTWIGGSEDDFLYGMTVDALGNAILVGETASPDFPLLAEFQAHQGSSDAFVTKLNAAGDGLVFSTYVGGGGVDGAGAVAVDSLGCVYVVGLTASNDFPTVGQYQEWGLSVDAFIVKLSVDGSSMLFGTYVGGTFQEDAADAVRVDDSGIVYAAGWTAAQDFPLYNPFQSDPPEPFDFDGWVAKLSPCLIALGGDLNLSASVTSGDIIYLVNYVFKTGPASLPCVAVSDINCSGAVTSADIIGLVNFVFKSGPAPCDVCPQIPGLWSCP